MATSGGRAWPRCKAALGDGSITAMSCRGSHQEDGSLFKDAPALLHPQCFLAVEPLETIAQILQFVWLPPIHIGMFFLFAC